MRNTNPLESSRDQDDRGPHCQLDAPLSDFLDDKAKTIDFDGEGNVSRSGTYVRDLERVVPKWISWMEDAGYETFGDLDGQAIGMWSRSELAGRVKQGEITTRTAWKYYRLVRAYLSYCSEWEYISGNPADTAVGKGPLPKKQSADSSDQQFWSPDQRTTLMPYVAERAYEAIDEHGADYRAFEAVRDRALCALIGYSGVRGSELLNQPSDDRSGRSGATWEAVDVENQRLRVLGKSQNREDVPTTNIPVEPLERWKHLLDPPSDQWPIFPSFHIPTLWRVAREQLSTAGFEDDEIDELFAPYNRPLDLFYELPEEIDCEVSLCPPAMSTSGGRSVMKRLTEAAGVDVSEDPKEYLTLHGGRRGAGEAYRREENLSEAQKALRHSDPAITENMYSHVTASEVSETGNSVFEAER